MASQETELILRALDDLRDDLGSHRRETRDDFACVSHRLDETRQLVARIDERTKPVEVEEVAPPSRRVRAKKAARELAPAAGVSAAVVALIELVPELIKVFQ